LKRPEYKSYFFLNPSFLILRILGHLFFTLPFATLFLLWAIFLLKNLEIT